MEYEIINGKKYKKCNEDKIRNPVSNRCVLKTSAIGKKILEPNKNKKPEIKKPEIKKPEIKKPEIKKTEIKKPEIKKPEIKKPEIKKPEIKKTEIKKPEIKKPEIKKTEIKKTEIKKPEIKKPEIKKTKIKKTEIKKTLDDKYTTDDCIKWLNNKKLDPKTKKTINETDDIYIKYSKYCNKLNRQAIKLQKYFVNKIKHKNNVIAENKNKVKHKHKNNFITEDKNEIIIEDKYYITITDTCILKSGNDLIIDNKVKLDKKFGSNSAYGINYISSFVINENNFKFSSKIQLIDNSSVKELYILKLLNRERKTINTLHYPLFYGYTTCSESKLTDKEQDVPALIRQNNSKGYMVIFNELLLGDLRYYIYNIAKENYNLWLNAIEQIYMCLAAFHATGLLHNDSHYGNFLYKKIKKGGYFKYIINGKDYYIPNLGYLWVIWDFGVSRLLHRHTEYIIDYNYLALYLRYNNIKLITSEFKRKFPLKENKGRLTPLTSRNWGFIEKSVKIPVKIQIIVDKLWKKSGESQNETVFIAKLRNNGQAENVWFETLLSDNILFNPNNYDDEDKPVYTFILETLRLKAKAEKNISNIINISIINFQKQGTADNVQAFHLLDYNLLPINKNIFYDISKQYPSYVNSENSENLENSENSENSEFSE